MFYSIFYFPLISQCVDSYWTSSGYPDLRGPTVSKCSIDLPPGTLYYVCDPDHVLNTTEGFISLILIHQIKFIVKRIINFFF